MIWRAAAVDEEEDDDTDAAAGGGVCEDEEGEVVLWVMILVLMTSNGVVKNPARPPEIPPYRVEVCVGIESEGDDGIVSS